MYDADALSACTRWVCVEALSLIFLVTVNKCKLTSFRWPTTACDHTKALIERHEKLRNDREMLQLSVGRKYGLNLRADEPTLLAGAGKQTHTGMHTDGSTHIQASGAVPMPDYISSGNATKASKNPAQMAFQGSTGSTYEGLDHFETPGPSTH